MKRKFTIIVLAALLFTQALASSATRQPTSNTTPDSGQGGNAVTSPSNTGHGSTTVSQTGAEIGVDTKSIIWTGFAAAPSGQVVSVTLSFGWSENGSITANGTSNFRVQYSINGGGAWTDALNHSNVTSSSSSTTSVILSKTQDLTQVQVRGRLQADSTDVGDSASLTASVSDITITVITQDHPPIVMQDDDLAIVFQVLPHRCGYVVRGKEWYSKGSTHAHSVAYSGYGLIGAAFPGQMKRFMDKH